MKFLPILAALAMFSGTAQSSEYIDAITAHLYSGTAEAGLREAHKGCAESNTEACFGAGLLMLVTAYEGLARDFYRHGAVMPGETPASILLGIGSTGPGTPSNPHPEQLTYPQFRDMLDRFVRKLDEAKVDFPFAGKSGDYVVPIDPRLVIIDFNGDGKASEGENLGALLDENADWAMVPSPEASATGSTKDKGTGLAPDWRVGFDRADAFWFAGYTQVVAAPFDLLLAHDFSEFFGAYMHRVFPRAGLPMQNHTTGGIMFVDPMGDSGIADMIASVHTLNFPVIDKQRLATVLSRLKTITALSRQNWEVILAETDDYRELVPSPRQTAIPSVLPVTQEVVDAWLATLDTVDQVLAGELLVPHWRFKQGFDLKLYFETAERTDLVMLFTGSGALPYLRDGPIADEQSFAEANQTLGYDWLTYAFWFN
jgi:hypothetical protein